jgi:hypothetical protein
MQEQAVQLSQLVDTFKLEEQSAPVRPHAPRKIALAA